MKTKPADLTPRCTAFNKASTARTFNAVAYELLDLASELESELTELKAKYAELKNQHTELTARYAVDKGG